MKIRPVGAELFYADGHDDANISSNPAKPIQITLKMGAVRFSATSEYKPLHGEPLSNHFKDQLLHTVALERYIKCDLTEFINFCGNDRDCNTDRRVSPSFI